MIRCYQLTFRYPTMPEPLLVISDLHLAPGSFTLVLGPTGAGKTTFLRCLNGLIPHAYGGYLTGLVCVDHRPTVAGSPRDLSRIVGTVLQDPEAQQVMETVEREVAFALENHGLPPAIIAQRVSQVLERLGIAHLRRRRLTTLSGGERQRVMLAAALALQPRVLVLDEPTSQLDPPAAADFLAALGALRAEGTTIVLAEHRLERVLPACTTLLALRPGQPALAGPPRAILPHVPLRPPVVELGLRLGWDPLPLSAAEARAHWSPPTGPVPSPGRPTPGSVLVRLERLGWTVAGRPILREISGEIYQGQVTALVGPNGAGKTTLLRLIAGLIPPSQGRLVWASGPTRRLGYLPQNPAALLFAPTVRAEVAASRRWQNLPGDGREWLERLELGPLAEADPRDLSVGQRQRVALAAVLATEPALLLLDEPTRGLDPQQKEALGQILRDLAADGRGLLVATHDVEFVARWCDRVLFLEAGRLRADGPPGPVLARIPGFAPQIAQVTDGLAATVEEALACLSHAQGRTP